MQAGGGGEESTRGEEEEAVEELVVVALVGCGWRTAWGVSCMGSWGIFRVAAAISTRGPAPSCPAPRCASSAV